MGRKGTQQPVPVADMLVDAVSKWEARRLYQHLNCQGNMATRPNKTIELWDRYTVTVNTKLLDDFDFISDLSEAHRTSNISELVTMYMALLGGDKVYDDIRAHIEKEYGYFSQKALLEITAKVDDCFPKAGNRAQRRSWKSLAY